MAVFEQTQADRATVAFNRFVAIINWLSMQRWRLPYYTSRVAAWEGYHKANHNRQTPQQYFLAEIVSEEERQNEV